MSHDMSHMAYTRKSTAAKPATEAAATTKTQGKVFHSLGALFETKSDGVPFVGPADDSLIEALGLQAPAGKVWKIFTSAKTSKAGDQYISVYLGLSDIRR